jgi:hypothetical protein
MVVNNELNESKDDEHGEIDCTSPSDMQHISGSLRRSEVSAEGPSGSGEQQTFQEEFSFFDDCDFQVYHITCASISHDELAYQSSSVLLTSSFAHLFSNDFHYFYYQHPIDNQKFYKLTCKLLSIKQVVQTLNSNIIQNEQLELEFSLLNKANLETQLRKRLDDHFRNNQ